MNILIVSKSRVSGTVIQQALTKVKDLNVSITFGQEKQIVKKVSSEQKIDLLVLIKSKNDRAEEQQLQFLHQLFGTPIIVLGSSNSNDLIAPWLKILPDFTFNPTDSNFAKNMEELLASIKSLSVPNNIKPEPRTNFGKVETQPGLNLKVRQRFKIIAIGASTGGPQILNYIFRNLPASVPVPILVVQHMPANFLPLFIEWLNKESPLNIVIAKEHQKIEPGFVYFAPGDWHMILADKERIKLIDEPPMHSVKPAVSYLFKSVAKVYGDQAIGILLTGMGKDGAQELGLMKNKGALTIVQDNESCVVFGMPGTALKLGAAQLVLSPEQIVQQIKSLFKI